MQHREEDIGFKATYRRGGGAVEEVGVHGIKEVDKEEGREGGIWVVASGGLGH